MTDDPKDDDPKPDARTLILARRARFVAAAMASISIACGKESKNPEPCLSVIEIDSGSSEPSSLDASITGDAGADGVDASTTDAASAPDASAPPKADAGTAPQACLRVAPPRPCLKVAPPRPCLLR